MTDARAYGGVLAAALVLGVATSLKRVYVSWHIASRQYGEFYSFTGVHYTIIVV